MRVAGIPLGVGQNVIDPLLTLALLHFDNADGSTTFTDSSPYANTFTLFSGSPTISTTVSKFSGSSLKTNGSNFENIRATNVNFNVSSDDFTIEDWFYQSASSASNRGLFAVRGDSSTMPISCRIKNGVLYGQIQLSSPTTLQIFAHQTAVSAGAFHHVALVRHNGVVTLYLDGVASTTTLSVGSTTLRAGATHLYIGAAAETLGGLDASLNGYQDEFRFRKEAVYTGNFTPPPAPFTY